MYDSKRLKQLRESKGLTQEDIAEKLNISIAQIRRHEKDTLPSSGDILKYAIYYGVTTDYIFGLSNDKYPEMQTLNLSEQEQDIVFSYRHDDLKQLLKTIINSME